MKNHQERKESVEVNVKRVAPLYILVLILLTNQVFVCNEPICVNKTCWSVKEFYQFKSIQLKLMNNMAFAYMYLDFYKNIMHK